MIRKLPFQRLVKEILDRVSAGAVSRMQHGALEALQEAAEAYLVCTLPVTIRKASRMYSVQAGGEAATWRCDQGYGCSPTARCSRETEPTLRKCTCTPNKRHHAEAVHTDGCVHFTQYQPDVSVKVCICR